jgi:hypothetical protein
MRQSQTAGTSASSAIGTVNSWPLGQRKLAVFWPKAAGKLDTSWLYRYFAEGNVGVGRAGALVAIHSTFL